jgi:signal transduction histidine kinase/streptogramin lyase
VWTGTYGGGLDRLDGHHVTHFRHDPKNPDSPANNNISSLVPDAQGGLWIGVHGDGLDYFDGRHFTHFPPNPGDPAGLPEAYLRPLLLDPRGTLWIVTARWGLVRFDTHTRKFTAYLLDPNQPGNQAMNFTEDIYSDGASIWVASPTNGLFRFDPETGKFTRHYTERDGLANNSVAGILGDDQGNVWVSTAKGLSRFDPRTETFRNYDMFDGLQGNEFSLHCRAKAPDGRLFFGGANGLSAFYPDKLVDNPIPPPVVLTDFELFNKPVKIGGKDSPLRQAINIASSIALRYDQSVFRFQFAAPDFTAPQKNRYAYRLDGFDPDWQYTDATRRFATYTHLDPGDYTFRVKASNNDGVWNEQGVALHVRILPPWWSTLWFRALALASILLSIWCAYQLRVRRLRREFHAQLDGRVDERMRIARELHDTLLQSFQGLMFSFQAARNLLPGRTDEAIRTLDHAIREGDGAIAEGRDAIQGLRANPALESNLEHLLRAVGKELASSSSTEGEPPAFQVTVEGARQPLSPLLQDEVYQIAREILRNAFHHAHASRIEAEIAFDRQFFRVRIRDNGKGIDRTVLEEGVRQGHWGLPGVGERAKRIGAQLKLLSEPGAGTEAELIVPARIAYGHRPEGSAAVS